MSTEKAIQTIIDTLGVDNDRIPLRRALRMCLAQLDELRARGLTWGQIAMRLTKAGARHKRGQPISEQQLRTEYGRLVQLRKEFSGSKPTQVVGCSPEKGRMLISEVKESGTKDFLLRAGPKSARNRLAELTSTRRPPLELDE